MLLVVSLIFSSLSKNGDFLKFPRPISKQILCRSFAAMYSGLYPGLGEVISRQFYAFRQ